MNHLLIGAADHTQRLLDLTEQPFLLIDDGPIADAFLARYKARVFDLQVHHFDPMRGMDYKRAREFAAIVYTASPEGKDTLTVRNGRRALVRLLIGAQARLDKLTGGDDPGTQEALAMLDDLLLSPILRSVLCKPTNFSFKGNVIFRLDRATIGDFDAFLMAALAIGQHKGHVIIPDFGFYGRDFQLSLIRQNRLTAAVQFLAELPPKLQRAVLLIKHKHGYETTAEDAETLAQFTGFAQGTTAYTDFLQNCTEQR